MTFTLTVGDTAPALSGYVMDGSGPVNLTGATVSVHIVRPKNLSKLIKTATVTGPSSGAWEVPWTAGDLSAAGTYYVEVEVTYSNTKIQTFAESRRKRTKFEVRNQFA